MKLQTKIAELPIENFGNVKSHVAVVIANIAKRNIEMHLQLCDSINENYSIGLAKQCKCKEFA